ncbi:MAG: 3-phosphoshikimate 1-carboxyvinyltransferase [Treponema sp.]|jgi:3-phosphoshikimate 1-carboxyvinyltransferase|nr:3-phosphoshikimate 1-carboxyvinyltransferase [Treponema sp.]
MYARISPHVFSGTVRVPASKSHTIRRLLMAALTRGVSEIDHPLDSLDARSCVAVCRALGADIREYRAAGMQNPNPPDAGGNKLYRWTLRGIDGPLVPSLPPLDVGNSGTTLFLALAAAALGSEPVTFTGDEQIRRRGAAPLLEALAGLGVRVSAAEGGCVPITVQGPWKGGRVSLPCPTSQYLSALLLAAPLAPAGTVTEIEVPLLNERPYVELTLSYLAAQGVPWEAAEDFSRFRIPGGGFYKPMNGPVPGDFSSAAFPACAAAVSGGTVTLLGLEKEDPQGDKAFFDMLVRMGCEVVWERVSVPPSSAAADTKPPEWRLTVSRKGPLTGGEFDLNATPDLLPVMAVTAAFAAGQTALVNVAHARIKETDRIAVMAEELGKRGIKTEELPGGLIIYGAGDRPAPLIRGGAADGRGDHRIVMALAAAALGASAPVEINSAESAAVTYPGFLELLA